MRPSRRSGRSGKLETAADAQKSGFRVGSELRRSLGELAPHGGASEPRDARKFGEGSVLCADSRERAAPSAWPQVEPWTCPHRSVI